MATRRPTARCSPRSHGAATGSCSWNATSRGTPATAISPILISASSPTTTALPAWPLGRDDIVDANAVIVGSYVPDGIAVGKFVQREANGVTAFYDIDTPVTLAALGRGECDYLSPALIPGYDLYLSFTGGPTLDRLEEQYGSLAARALYCSVDTAAYYPTGAAKTWDLSYLGTYSPDRQPTLTRLLIDVARRCPDRRFRRGRAAISGRHRLADERRSHRPSSPPPSTPPSIPHRALP